MQPADDERSIGSLFSDLARETAALVRTEVELAKAEIIERLSQFSRGVAMLIAAGLLLYTAFLALLFAATLGLGQAFGWWSSMPWLPPLIVGALVAALGVALLMKGKSNVKPTNLVPRRTMASIKEDSAWVREKVR